MRYAIIISILLCGTAQGQLPDTACGPIESPPLRDRMALWTCPSEQADMSPQSQKVGSPFPAPFIKQKPTGGGWRSLGPKNTPLIHDKPKNITPTREQTPTIVTRDSHAITQTIVAMGICATVLIGAAVLGGLTLAARIIAKHDTKPRITVTPNYNRTLK